MREIIRRLFQQYMSRAGLQLNAIPLVVDATAHAALPDTTKALYITDGAGGFKLDVTGVEDTTALKASLESERKASQAAKIAAKKREEEILKQYEGIDPVKTREMMQKLGTDEEAALIAAGKLDEVIERRMEKHNKAQKDLLDAAAEREGGALEVASTFMEQVLDNHIRAAAAQVGIHPKAIEDALLRGRALFSLSDDGEAVQFDDDDETIILGKDGKSPFTPLEWLEGMREQAPHWFPAGASGGGASGGRNQNAGAKTMKRAAFEALSPAEKLTTAKAGIALTD